MCHSLSFVAAGIGQWLHDGWSHSHPPGHRYRRGAGPSYSGTKTLLAISTLPGEGEVFGKEVVSRPARFYRIYDTFIKKISQTTISLPTYKEE
jgi:hypothetical protein